MASIRWSPEIIGMLKTISENIRFGSEKLQRNIITDYFNVLDFVLTDIFTQGFCYLEPEKQMEITKFIVDNFSLRDKGGKIYRQGKFLDLTIGPKISIFKKYNLFKVYKNIAVECDSLIAIETHFKEIERYLVLRNKGEQHAASNPYELIDDKLEITSVSIKELDLLFTKFLLELEIKFFPNTFSVISNIPPQECREFIGRTGFKNEVLDQLRKENVRAINIHAFGGYGKTELVKQVAFELIQNDPQFDAVLWTSAKLDKFVSNSASETGEIVSSGNEQAIGGFSEILNIILRKVMNEAQEDLNKYDLSLKRSKIERLLKEKSILLILDNFETIENEPDVKRFIKNLQDFPNNLKLIITSRHEVNEIFVYNMQLQPFSKKEVADYLRSAFAGAGQQFRLSEEFIQKIKDKSFGHPFALQFMARWLLNGKIDEKNVDKVIINAINSTQIGDFCFKKDYSELKEKTRLLLCIAVYKGDSVNEEGLRLLAQNLLGISEIDFPKEWHVLAEYNLVRRIESGEKIIVPEMVKHYVKLELINQDIFSNKYKGKIKLSQAIGEAYKEIESKHEGWLNWMELCNKTVIILNENNSEQEIFRLLEQFKKWEKYKDKDSLYHFYLAQLLERTAIPEDYGEAINHIIQAIQSNPLFLDYRLFYADMLIKKGDLEKAIAVLQDALIDGYYTFEVIKRLCELVVNYEEMQPIFDLYYTDPTLKIPDSDQFKVRLILWKNLLRLGYAFVHENVSQLYMDSSILNQTLDKILTHLQNLEVFIDENSSIIFTSWIVKVIEIKIRTLRDMAKIFRYHLKNQDADSKLVILANSTQEKYQKIGVFRGQAVNKYDLVN